MITQEQWLQAIGKPNTDEYEKSFKLIAKYDYPDFDGELYLQSTGVHPDGELIFQRVLMMFPKNLTEKMPAVAVPFYYPEAALGFELDTGEVHPKFNGSNIILDIVRHGYIAITADAYYLNYVDLPWDRDEWDRWETVGRKLNEEQPGWTGMGKLVSDTILLLDALENDPRVDTDRIGIAGHSMGGKMAMYAGCLDSRVKVIMTSDLGIKWEQSNWGDCWYFGEKLDEMKAQGLDHTSLLASAAPKPFCLLAGHYDNDESRQLLASVPGYEDCPGNLLFINHATGHRPPQYAIDAGCGFLDYWLKGNR